jgi:DNA-binding MarR family transcriptional regulator
MPVLSASEARALIELVAARGIAQGQLGTLLGLEKSTVSRLAAGLERKGCAPGSPGTPESSPG